MAKTMMNVIVAAVALAAMLHRTEATEYIVGDALGWTIPTGGAATYADWAATHTFEINADSITFDFAAGEQDVAIVCKEDFDSCTTTNPQFESPDPINVGLNQPDTVYFICTFAGHCDKGQKVAVQWTSSLSAATPAPNSTSVSTDGGRPPLKFRYQRSVKKHGNMTKMTLLGK